MARKHILLEVTQQTPDAFGYNAVLFEAPSTADAEHASEAAIADLGGYGLELEDDIAPVPMFETKECVGPLWRLSTEMASSSPETATDMAANTLVVPCSVRSGDHERLCRHEGVNVWPNSELTLFSDDSDAEEPFLDAVAAASSAGGMDCRPFRPGVPVSTIRHLLGVEALWRQGYRGQNVIVGIVDDGVDATTYPVIGGFSRPGSGRLPGAAPVTSHGSMCAADLLIAAPASRLYDYPFIGVPRSGGALQSTRRSSTSAGSMARPTLPTTATVSSASQPAACSPTTRSMTSIIRSTARYEKSSSPERPFSSPPGTAEGSAQAADATPLASDPDAPSMRATVSPTSLPLLRSTAITNGSATPHKEKECSTRRNPMSRPILTSMPTSAQGGQAALRSRSIVGHRRRARWRLESQRSSFPCCRKRHPSTSNELFWRQRHRWAAMLAGIEISAMVL